MLKLIPHLFGA